MQGPQTKGKTPVCLHEKRITGGLTSDWRDRWHFFKKRNVKPKSLSIAGKWSLVVSFT